MADKLPPEKFVIQRKAVAPAAGGVAAGVGLRRRHLDQLPVRLALDQPVHIAVTRVVPHLHIIELAQGALLLSAWCKDMGTSCTFLIRPHVHTQPRPSVLRYRQNTAVFIAVDQGKFSCMSREVQISQHAHSLRLDLQRIAVAGFFPVVDRVLGMVPPAPQMAADEADPHVARTPTHLRCQQAPGLRACLKNLHSISGCDPQQ